MHLLCGRMNNNCLIANCPQSVSVNEFSKSVNNWQRYTERQKLGGTVLWPTVYVHCELLVRQIMTIIITF